MGTPLPSRIPKINLSKYVNIGRDQWRFCQVVVSASGRIKSGLIRPSRALSSTGCHGECDSLEKDSPKGPGMSLAVGLLCVALVMMSRLVWESTRPYFREARVNQELVALSTGGRIDFIHSRESMFAGSSLPTTPHTAPQAPAPSPNLSCNQTPLQKPGCSTTARSPGTSQSGEDLPAPSFSATPDELHPHATVPRQ
jgi:hypothetical protein